jgi:hypothetical protein
MTTWELLPAASGKIIFSPGIGQARARVKNYR